MTTTDTNEPTTKIPTPLYAAAGAGDLAMERLRKLPLPPEITFFDVGTEVKDNVAIESLDYSRLMVGVGQKI